MALEGLLECLPLLEVQSNLLHLCRVERRLLHMLPRFEALASEGLGQFAHAELAQGLAERAHLDESLVASAGVAHCVGSRRGEPGESGESPMESTPLSKQGI